MSCIFYATNESNWNNNELGTLRKMFFTENVYTLKLKKALRKNYAILAVEQFNSIKLDS